MELFTIIFGGLLTILLFLIFDKFKNRNKNNQISVASTFVEKEEEKEREAEEKEEEEENERVEENLTPPQEPTSTNVEDVESDVESFDDGNVPSSEAGNNISGNNEVPPPVSPLNCRVEQLPPNQAGKRNGMLSILCCQMLTLGNINKGI